MGPLDAIVVTFTADSTDFNIWIWPAADNGEPKVEVNAAPKGTSEWMPHLGPVEVEVQGSLAV